MNKRYIATLIIILVFSSLSLVYADYNHTYEETFNNNIIKVIDYSPKHIEHHHCGIGGTNCADCLTQNLWESCGCHITKYKCCCGKVTGTLIYFCENHRD